MSQWTDMIAMIEDIRNHVKTTGKPVEIDDDPLHRRLGYRDGEKTWWISFTDAKKTLATHPAISKMMASEEDRLTLVH